MSREGAELSPPIRRSVACTTNFQLPFQVVAVLSSRLKKHNAYDTTGLSGSSAYVNHKRNFARTKNSKSRVDCPIATLARWACITSAVGFHFQNQSRKTEERDTTSTRQSTAQCNDLQWLPSNTLHLDNFRTIPTRSTSSDT